MIALSLAAAVGCGDDDGSDGDAAPPTGRDAAGGGMDGAGPVEGDGAELVAADLPAALPCGERRAASVTLRNTGTTTWTPDAFKLGAVGDADPFVGPERRVWLPAGASVAPGAEHRFDFELVAPPMAVTGRTDWQMVHEGVGWFGDVAAADVTVGCDRPRRTGPVVLDDHSLSDDGGRFEALGATMMWAAWAYKFDRPRLERNLAFLAEHGFDFFRALGVVGDPEREDHWDGREIEWRWPDYAEVIAGLTDLAYDVYGLRVEWTLIGDGQVAVPDEADRYALVDTFVEMAATRRQKILFFEIANESWQNGFGGDDGLAQLRALTRYMRDRTEVLVAASAPAGAECSDVDAVYGGDVADLATIHFDRQSSLVDGPWRPVRQPWEHENCPGPLPVGVNNEPIGPGSSVVSEDDPARLVSAALVTWVAQLPIHVFHSNAGVRGDSDLSTMAGADAFVHLGHFVPDGLASFTRRNFYMTESPFVIFIETADGALLPDTVWPDQPDARSGMVRAYSGIDGDRFFTIAFGIRGDAVVAARRAMEVEVIDPLTGETIEARSLVEDDRLTLGGGRTAVVLRGTYR